MIRHACNQEKESKSMKNVWPLFTKNPNLEYKITLVAITSLLMIQASYVTALFDICD